MKKRFKSILLYNFPQLKVDVISGQMLCPWPLWHITSILRQIVWRVSNSWCDSPTCTCVTPSLFNGKVNKRFYERDLSIVKFIHKSWRHDGKVIPLVKTFVVFLINGISQLVSGYFNKYNYACIDGLPKKRLTFYELIWTKKTLWPYRNEAITGFQDGTICIL